MAYLILSLFDLLFSYYLVLIFIIQPLLSINNFGIPSPCRGCILFKYIILFPIAIISSGPTKARRLKQEEVMKSYHTVDITYDDNYMYQL